MVIKETNDPKVLKKYIRYVVGKYHELGKKYVGVNEKRISSSSEIFCLKLEVKERKESEAKLIQEIKNLYRTLGEETNSSILDILSTDMLELKNSGELNSSQLNLFCDACDDDEVPPIIEFNEVDLTCPDYDENHGCVDKVDTKIQ